MPPTVAALLSDLGSLASTARPASLRSRSTTQPAASMPPKGRRRRLDPAVAVVWFAGCVAPRAWRHVGAVSLLWLLVSSGPLVAGCAAHSEPADAARGREPARGASRELAEPLVLAEGPRCSVSLNKLSYDDPGADDAEWLELLVQPSGAPRPSTLAATSAEAGTSGAATLVQAAPSDAGGPDAPDGGPLLLGDCGLGALELVNGGVDPCAMYRRIDLAQVPVPEDGFVLLCAGASSIHATWGCDVLRAADGALQNGWLQNGASDGLRFTDATGTVVASYSYEGVNASCWSEPPLLLPQETGTAAGTSSEDDVAAACGSGWVLLPLGSAEPRTAPSCPRPTGVNGDGGAGGDSGLGGAAGARTASDSGVYVTPGSANSTSSTAVVGSVDSGADGNAEWSAGLLGIGSDAGDGGIRAAPALPRPAMACTAAPPASRREGMVGLFWVVACAGCVTTRRAARGVGRRLRRAALPTSPAER